MLTHKQNGLIHAQINADLMQITKLGDESLQEIMQIVKSVAWHGTPYGLIQKSVCILMILMIDGVKCGDRRMNIFVDVGKHFCSRVIVAIRIKNEALTVIKYTNEIL